MKKEKFLEEANKIHNNKYCYEIEEDNIKLKGHVKTICPVHGEFDIIAYEHIRKHRGYPKCAAIERGNKQTSNTDEFIKKAKELHGDKYDYSDTEYKGYEIPVKIICPKHGEFLQTTDCHLHSGGCPICGSVSSKGENEILELIKSKIGNENVLQRDRKIINGYEIDIYIPSRKIAIEYNGILWHSERYGKDKNYHLDKTIRCKNKNINLIQIFEDEYLNHKDIVISKVLHQLHLDNENPV